jgi:hypothetical protein
MHVERALRKAQTVECKICGRTGSLWLENKYEFIMFTGASIRCYKLDCVNKDFAFHLPCAKRSNGQFVKDKVSIQNSQHFSAFHIYRRFIVLIMKFDKMLWLTNWVPWDDCIFTEMKINFFRKYLIILLQLKWSCVLAHSSSRKLVNFFLNNSETSLQRTTYFQ